MITISLCMIVKNEEAVLARCLDSVREAVDEIIIVDTGSTDQTRAIAARYTDRVYNFRWIDDFSAARNFAYARATMDYQLWLDADDVLPDAERAKLLALKRTLDPSVDMVTMKYHTHFGADGAPILTSTRERLTRREKGFAWQDPVHECIPLVPGALHSDITVWHLSQPGSKNPRRNLDIYTALEAKGGPLTPRQQYYFARELRDNGLYAKAVGYFTRFLDGGQGWAEDIAAACLGLAACHWALGDEQAALAALLRSFSHGGPRAEICCQLGYHHKGRGDYQAALGWFQAAARLDPPESLGFVQRDYQGYIPNLESCVCCCHLGRYGLAAHYNRLAGEAKPGDAAVAHNEAYLATLSAHNAP